MSLRIAKSWVVLASFENEEHDRCVDLFERADGSFGFEEFRRDVEDRGTWTPVAYFSGRSFHTLEQAEAMAEALFPGLPASISRRRRKQWVRSHQFDSSPGNTGPAADPAPDARLRSVEEHGR
jgi:hypothetical protein